MIGSDRVITNNRSAGSIHVGCATRVQIRHSKVRRVKCLLRYEGLIEKLRCTQACMVYMESDRQLRTLFRYAHQSSGVRHYEGLKMNLRQQD